MDIIKPITVEIERELWERFKMTVTRDRTLNEAVVDLIKVKVEETKPSSDDSAMIPKQGINKTSDVIKVSLEEVKE